MLSKCSCCCCCVVHNIGIRDSAKPDEPKLPDHLSSQSMAIPIRAGRWLYSITKVIWNEASTTATTQAILDEWVNRGWKLTIKIIFLKIYTHCCFHDRISNPPEFLWKKKRMNYNFKNVSFSLLFVVRDWLAGGNTVFPHYDEAKCKKINFCSASEIVTYPWHRYREGGPGKWVCGDNPNKQCGSGVPP